MRKMKIVKFSLLLVTSVLFLSCGNSGNNITSFEKNILKDWKLESSTQVNVEDSTISSLEFNDSKWADAKVPTTVLRALVKAGIYPDPILI
jgi:hypothetical protein